MHGSIPPFPHTSYGLAPNEAEEPPTHETQLGVGFKPPQAVE